MEYQIDNIYVKRFLYFNLYVIKGVNGDILIDTGFIGIKKELKKWLDQFNIKLVILTHAHVDHAWNAAYIKKLYNCKIALGKDDIENIDNRNIKAIPSNSKHSSWTKLMNYGMKKFIPNHYDVDLKLSNNQVIRKYKLNLKIVSLPGHTKGSIGVVYKDYLFAGDALVNRKEYPEIAYQNQDNKEAISSYYKIIELAPKVIFVGHDNKITLEELKEEVMF